MRQEPEVVKKLKQSYRFVDLVFGTHNIFKFAELLVRCFEEQKMVIDIWDDTKEIVEELPVSKVSSSSPSMVNSVKVVILHYNPQKNRQNRTLHQTPVR